MKDRLTQFVEKIVHQIEGNQQEKNDLFEELLTHLELSKEHFMKDGFTEQEAETKAMEQFGNEAEVGEQIQQAMFPFRKEMMRLLAITSIIFSIAIYLAQLFIEGDAYILWLILSMVVSTFLLVFSIQSIAFLNRRLWMNGLLIIHILIYSFGALLTTGVTEVIVSRTLSIFAGLIILFAIILIYRTTIHDYKASDHPLPKHAKWFHIINITAGVVVVFVMLFFMWGMAIMIGGMSPAMAITFVPVLVWIGIYLLQMNLLRKRIIKGAYIAAVIPIFIIILFLLYIVLIASGM